MKKVLLFQSSCPNWQYCKLSTKVIVPFLLICFHQLKALLLLDKYLVGFSIFAEISDFFRVFIFPPVHWLKKSGYSSLYYYRKVYSERLPLWFAIFLHMSYKGKRSAATTFSTNLFLALEMTPNCANTISKHGQRLWRSLSVRTFAIHEN